MISIRFETELHTICLLCMWWIVWVHECVYNQTSQNKTLYTFSPPHSKSTQNYTYTKSPKLVELITVVIFANMSNGFATVLNICSWMFANLISNWSIVCTKNANGHTILTVLHFSLNSLSPNAIRWFQCSLNLYTTIYDTTNSKEYNRICMKEKVDLLYCGRLEKLNAEIETREKLKKTHVKICIFCRVNF